MSSLYEAVAPITINVHVCSSYVFGKATRLVSPILSQRAGR